jgi:hypothetical protein
MIELGTPKQKMMSCMKSTTCLEPILARGLASTHLVNLSIMRSRWVQPPGCFFEEPQKVQTPYGERPSDGDRLELLGWGVDLNSKVLAPPAGFHYLGSITNCNQPVKTLSEGLPDHAPQGSVMPTDPSVDIEEQLHAFLRGGDTLLEDA